ncbi:MAG TPA: DUF2267 domain-containing protein [Solirubrobacteraceae bacterium]|nr:DUF2267 domain-containing protein [Solirubrobacteraceae bacterium]
MARGQFNGYDDAWRFERFIATIETRAGITWDRAEGVARAVLETLSRRLDREEVLELASELPPHLSGWLLESAEAQPKRFGPEEFVRRVAERAGEDERPARAQTEAVFVALARLVRHREIQELAHQLPASYRKLLGEALHPPREPSRPEVLGIKEFMRRVEDRIGTSDPEVAVRATEAVLETLAERLAAGEVEDMLEVLPEELHAPLERGLAASRQALRMSLDEFVGRIAEREDVTMEAALDHARAVLTTLREALPDKEFSDMLAELPRAYYEALL